MDPLELTDAGGTPTTASFYDERQINPQYFASVTNTLEREQIGVFLSYQDMLALVAWGMAMTDMLPAVQYRLHATTTGRFSWPPAPGDGTESCIMVPVAPEIAERLDKDWSEPAQFLLRRDDSGYELLMRTVQPSDQPDVRCLCTWARPAEGAAMALRSLHPNCHVHMGSAELLNGLQREKS